MEARRLHNGYARSQLPIFGSLADLMKATCPKCDNDRAYFYQLQIRSADEPMTTCGSLFYLPHTGTIALTFCFRLQSIGQWGQRRIFLLNDT
jgi:Transcription factor S-II (TFIIS)